MNLSTEFLGLNLKNPIIIASGPWSRDGVSIQKCIDQGAGAVITETVTLEARKSINPHIFYENNRLFNTKLFSAIDIEQWESEIEAIDKKDSKLIFSIWASTPSELGYLAEKVERLGADAIEISLSAPIGAKSQALNMSSNNIYEYVRSVVKSVDIPVMVKLGYDACTSVEFLSEIEAAGATAISAIDSLKGIIRVDIENQRSVMPTFGGYTGENIRPISLATTASLQQLTSLVICSSGGIIDYENVLEFIMLGAQCVQLASIIMLKGYPVISEIINNLSDWVTNHGYNSPDAIRGTALKTLIPFEDIATQSRVCEVVNNSCTRCGVCRTGCLYDAISIDKDGVSINNILCRGCGFCISRCECKCLKLKWRN